MIKMTIFFATAQQNIHPIQMLLGSLLIADDTFFSTLYYSSSENLFACFKVKLLDLDVSIMSVFDTCDNSFTSCNYLLIYERK